MNRKNQKLTHRQERAIAALLSAPSQSEAANQTGVSERTLRNWLKQAEFRRAFKTASWRALEIAIGRLEAATGEALETLRKALSCGQAATEVKAAIGILSHGLKVAELFTLQERVELLEKAIMGKEDEFTIANQPSCENGK